MSLAYPPYIYGKVPGVLRVGWVARHTARSRSAINWMITKVGPRFQGGDEMNWKDGKPALLSTAHRLTKNAILILLPPFLFIIHHTHLRPHGLYSSFYLP